MIITRSACYAGLALLLGSAAMAQAPASSPSALDGAWSADCDAWGAPASCLLEWRPGLHPDLMTVAYQIRSRETGAMIFEGRGVYDISAADRPTGYWSDSGGAVHPLAGRWRENALTTHWGAAGGVLGRTRYQLEPDGGLQVTDWRLTETAWVEFMSVRYTRAAETPDQP